MPLYIENNRAWTPMSKTFYSQPLSKRGVRNKDGTFKGKEPTEASWIKYRDSYTSDYSYDPATDTWLRLAPLAAFSISVHEF
jgi:hypothetical protein